MKTKYIIRILGVRKLVRLGDKMVDWNDSFRLFLFSRSTVPTLSSSPQSYAMVNVINFNTTEAGLSEQVSLEIGKILIENFDCSNFCIAHSKLVALTVRYENPELEQRKKQLLEQEEQLKLQLAQLEEKLLQTLGNSQGNILENKVDIKYQIV